MEGEISICPACGGTEISDLPIPHPLRSMTSDGRIISSKLRKCACRTCGYGFHREPPSPATLHDFYDDSYDLGLRDRAAELSRSRNYAEQIIELLPRSEIGSLVELGCGIGTLLADMVDRLGCRYAVGVEPSRRLASAASAAAGENVCIHHTFAEDFAQNATDAFDLCISVNVAEHTFDPANFLRACRKLTTPGGIVVVVCPDGEMPSSELLFYDHISSFTRHSLGAFASKAGLAIVKSKQLEGQLFGFSAHVLQKGQSETGPHDSYNRLAEGRARYLTLWRDCESTVGDALSGTEYGIFGTGEFADLLAAYAPSVIDKAAFFVVDSPTSGICHGKPVISSEHYLSSQNIGLLAAVNERSWGEVSKRFLSLGAKIVHPHSLENWSNP